MKNLQSEVCKTAGKLSSKGGKLLVQVSKRIIILKIYDREIIRIPEFIYDDVFIYREGFFCKFQELFPAPIQVCLEVAFKQLDGIGLIVFFRQKARYVQLKTLVPQQEFHDSACVASIAKCPNQVLHAWQKS